MTIVHYKKIRKLILEIMSSTFNDIGDQFHFTETIYVATVSLLEGQSNDVAIQIKLMGVGRAPPKMGVGRASPKISWLFYQV